MKTLALSGLLVLALLAIPAAVAAGSTATISGTIPSGTTITVTPATMSLGTVMPPRVFDGLTVAVNLTTGEMVNWRLLAQDLTGSGSPGFMYSSANGRYLTQPFKIKDLTLTPNAYVPLNTGPVTWYNGVGTGITNVNALFHQDIERTDLSGSYQIVVTFTSVAA